jgi:hypothetical protein
MKCRNCGAEFESRFCPECGTRAVVEAEGRQTVEKERGAEKPEYYLSEADSKETKGKIKVLMCRNGKEEKQISVQSEQSVLDFCESKKYVFYVQQIENNLFNIFMTISRAGKINLYRYAKATGKTEQLTIKGDGYNWPGSIHCTEEYLLLFYQDDDMDEKLLLMNTDGKRMRHIDAEELDVDELCNISIVGFYDNCIWYQDTEEETLFVYRVDTDTAKKISSNVSLAASDENNVYYLREDDCDYEAVRCSIEGKDRTIIGRVETSLSVTALTVENGKPVVWAKRRGSYLAAEEKTKVEIKAL